MKNVQVIDGANNSEYAIYALTDEEFKVIFPMENQNVEFIEDVLVRVEEGRLGRMMDSVWGRKISKLEVVGIHGTLFYGLNFKKKYYPTKNDEEMVRGFVE